MWRWVSLYFVKTPFIYLFILNPTVHLWNNIIPRDYWIKKENWHCQGGCRREPRVVQPYNLHGSRAMKWAPRAGWIFVGFGVAISLLFAIFVLALANSKRRVWGLSGSKRIPWGKRWRGEWGGGWGGVDSIVRESGLRFKGQKIQSLFSLLSQVRFQYFNVSLLLLNQGLIHVSGQRSSKLRIKGYTKAFQHWQHLFLLMTVQEQKPPWEQLAPQEKGGGGDEE